MKVFRRLSRPLAVPMAAVMLMMSVPIGAANAGLIGTEQALALEVAEAERSRVLDFLARDDVRAGLIGLGVDPAQAAARVAGLSDAEIRDIAGSIGQLPAGQEFFGSIIGAALVVFLVLLVTDILGLTDVFSFVRP
jgi:hypothetical protein